MAVSHGSLLPKPTDARAPFITDTGSNDHQLVTYQINLIRSCEVNEYYIPTFNHSTAFPRPLFDSFEMDPACKEPDRPKTTFLHLPAELRNRIYELSGCLTVVQCENCRKHCTLDIVTLGQKRSCSGNPRIQWPIKYPRHFICRFVVCESVDLSRYAKDRLVRHEYIDGATGDLAVPQPYETAIPQQPALTLVCRQLRSETLPVYYGRNKFDFTPKVTTVDGVGRIAKPDVAWLTSIGPANASLIRMVEVRWLGWCRRALLANFKENLRELGVRVDELRVEVSCWYVSWKNCYVLRRHYVDVVHHDESTADECACA